MRSSLVNRLLLPVAVLVFYFVLPLGVSDAPVGTVAGIVLSAASLVLVAVVVFREVMWASHRLRPMHLVVAFELVLVAFALGYYLLASAQPEQFVSLDTRLDALYFSMTTMATVGYGDVSAAGQAARGIVTFQLAFNIVFVGALVNLLRDRIRVARDQPTDGD